MGIKSKIEAQEQAQEQAQPQPQQGGADIIGRRTSIL